MKKITILLMGALILVSGCATPGKRTGIGAGAGAGAGAAIGGAAGGWKGAGIGAIAGAATGAIVGNYLDKQYNELEKVADTKRLENGILVNLKNDLLFPTNSSTLRSTAITQLTEIGTVLAKYKDDRIRIEGYTDSVGTELSNEQLSLRRANAVKDVLRAQGVQEFQMLTTGFGESHPIASNKTEAGRAQNRRVELFIDVPESRKPAAESPSN